jgi:glycosyltransferase involved in cell wall biosynthesis
MERSGVAHYTSDLARALTREGAEVEVIAPAAPGLPVREEDHGVAVWRAFRRGPLVPVHAAGAACSTGASVVHLQHEHFLYGSPSSALATLAALGYLSRRRPVVVTLHQVVDAARVDRAFVRLHRVSLPAPAARAGLAVLQNGVADLARRTIVHEPAFARTVPRATVIPHGVRSQQGPGRAEARESLALDDRFTVLCFGYIAPYKGLETVLEAGRLLGGRVRVVVAGGPHPRLGDAERYAAQLARGYRDAATFTGYVAEERVPAWFSAADVAVFPYPRPHATSGALSLALAHSTPFLASEALGRLAGLPQEAVVDLAPAALAERLEDLMAGDALGALSRACASMAAGRSWSEVACAHRSLYEEVVP